MVRVIESSNRDYVITKRNKIYDKLSTLLTDIDDAEIDCDSEIYDLLVEIQRNWEDVITAQVD
jgi:hypothetical protein